MKFLEFTSKSFISKKLLNQPDYKMCAQKNDKIIQPRLLTSLESHLKLLREFQFRRQEIEKEYFQWAEERFALALDLSMRLIQKIEEVIEYSSKLLTKDKFRETQDTLRQLSPGQPKCYGYVLRAYQHQPRFYSIYEIMDINKLSKSRYWMILRFLRGVTDPVSKNQRGNKAIEKILEIKKIYKGNKPKNYYRPAGYFESLIEIIYANSFASRSISGHIRFLHANYRKINEALNRFQEFADEYKNVCKQLKSTIKKLPNQKDKKTKMGINKSINSLADETAFEEQFTILQSFIEDRIKKTGSPKMYESLSKKLERFDTDDLLERFDHYDLKYASYQKDILKLLLKALKQDLLVNDFYLFHLQLFRIRFQRRQGERFLNDTQKQSELDAKWEYDGIEPYLELKRKQDELFEKNVIGKRMYYFRLSLLRDAIKRGIRERFSLTL